MMAKDILRANKCPGVLRKVADTAVKVVYASRTMLITAGANPIATSLRKYTMLVEDYIRIKKGNNGNGIIFSFYGFISEGLLFGLGEGPEGEIVLERKRCQ